MLRRAYHWMAGFSRSPRASWALAGFAFVEAIIFPIPPDLLLLPLCLGAPKRSLHFAAICTVASLAGALGGYAIGYWVWEGVAPYFYSMVPGLSEAQFNNAKSLYAELGPIAVLVAAFSPIPFKVLTITSGVLSLSLPQFLAAAALGRAGRFFAIGGLVRAFGPKIEVWIERYFAPITWGLAVLGVLGFVALRFL